MATYYLHGGLGTGDDDGSSQANAWSTWQRAIDGTDGVQPGAGDTILMKGGETLVAVANSTTGITGTVGSRVQWIGVNSSWVEDGTRYDVDVDGRSHHGISMGGAIDYWSFRNIAIHGCGPTDKSGFYHSLGSDYHRYQNCISYNNSGKGFFGPNDNGGYHRCVAYGNTLDGFNISGGKASYFTFCRSSGNTVAGFTATADFILCYGCVAYENTGVGFKGTTGSKYIHCVSDDNSDAFNAYEQDTIIIGCRATSSTNGVIYEAGIYGTIIGLYTGGNSGTELTAQFDELFAQGALSLLTTEGSDTDHGYVDAANDDYNLDADEATYYSQAVELP